MAYNLRKRFVIIYINNYFYLYDINPINKKKQPLIFSAELEERA